MNRTNSVLSKAALAFRLSPGTVAVLACLIYTVVILLILTLIIWCKKRWEASSEDDDDDEVEADDEEELISDGPEEDELPPSYEDVVTDYWDAVEVVSHKPVVDEMTRTSSCSACGQPNRHELGH